MILDRAKITGHQRKQVTGLAERIFPPDPVTTIIEYTLINRVTVGQQHRIFLFVRNHRRSEAGHHVWTVEIIGDPAKTFCFTLRTEVATGFVQSFQRGIFLWPDDGFDFKAEIVRDLVNGQLFFGHLVVSSRKRLSIQFNRTQLHMLAIENQWVVIRKSLVLPQCQR